MFATYENYKESLNLKENRKGRSSQFSPQGKLALMFLKAYSHQSSGKYNLASTIEAKSPLLRHPITATWLLAVLPVKVELRY